MIVVDPARLEDLIWKLDNVAINGFLDPPNRRALKGISLELKALLRGERRLDVAPTSPRRSPDIAST